jgi:hypothetical protein
VIFTTTTVWSSVCSASFRNACIAPNSAPTMSLADYFSKVYDGSGLDKFKQEAMRSGPSAWP